MRAKGGEGQKKGEAGRRGRERRGRVRSVEGSEAREKEEKRNGRGASLRVRRSTPNQAVRWEVKMEKGMKKKWRRKMQTK